MTKSGEKKDKMDELVEIMFNLAINRDDLKKVISEVPKESDINPVTMEYEIQLLKILSVGWGISYFMGDHPDKNRLAHGFWNAIRDFSISVSKMTSSATGEDIDYFNILRERVDIYVQALNHFSDVKDPSTVIGPTFAKLCGNEEEAYSLVSGKAIFNSSILNVKNQLESANML